MKKLVYNLKLSVIVVLCILILALVEIAPSKPVLFLFIAAVYIVSIRLLWKSAERDERQVKRTILPIKNKPGKNPDKNARAA